MKMLKELRKKLHLTQCEVASVLGIGQSGYSQIENGNRILTIKNAKKLASFYGIDWKLFFEEQ